MKLAVDPVANPVCEFSCGSKWTSVARQSQARPRIWVTRSTGPAVAATSRSSPRTFRSARARSDGGGLRTVSMAAGSVAGRDDVDRPVPEP